MAIYSVRARAWREIDGCLEFLEARAGTETADRFLNSLVHTFSDLAQMPRQGILCGFQKPSLLRLRRWKVRGFEDWLVFYLPKRNGIEILHIVHGARNIEALFD